MVHREPAILEDRVPSTMKPLGEFEVWFLTGSQDLYGEEKLRQVTGFGRELRWNSAYYHMVGGR
jgi:hypothetical protein